MAAPKEDERRKQNIRNNVLILYKNPLPDKIYFLNNKNIGAVKNKIDTEPIVIATSWRFNYVETQPIYHKFLSIVVDKRFYKFKIPIQNRALRQIESDHESNGENIILISTKRSFTLPNCTNSLTVDSSDDNGSSVDVNGLADLCCGTVQTIVYNFICSDKLSIMFFCFDKLEHMLNKFSSNNVKQSKRNQLDIFEKQSQHEMLFKYNPDKSLKVHKNTPLRIQEESKTCNIKVVKPAGVWKCINYKFKPKKPLVTCKNHWHIRNTCHGYTLRNILRRLNVNTLTFMKNNYFVLITKAKITTNITLQPKNLIITFCKRQDTFVDKLFRINNAHILICSTCSFRHTKDMPKDDPVVIETLQNVMYSRGSTTSSNIVILRNYLQSKNNNSNKSLKNSLSDLKNPCIMYNNTEFEDGGFKTFAILSIDNLLAHHYNIMQTQTVNNSLNQNKHNDKMHCNSTFIVGKIWLRDFISNSQYIKSHFNKTLYRPDFINETMFDTPLLDRYVEVVNKVYHIFTTPIIYKNILKPLGQNFIYIIFSNR